MSIFHFQCKMDDDEIEFLGETPAPSSSGKGDRSPKQSPDHLLRIQSSRSPRRKKRSHLDDGDTGPGGAAKEAKRVAHNSFIQEMIDFHSKGKPSSNFGGLGIKKKPIDFSTERPKGLRLKPSTSLMAKASSDEVEVVANDDAKNTSVELMEKFSTNSDLLSEQELIIISLETSNIKESFAVNYIKAHNIKTGRCLESCTVVPTHLEAETIERLGFFELGDHSWVLSLPEENRPAITEKALLDGILDMSKSLTTSYRIVFTSSVHFAQFRSLAKRNNLWNKFDEGLKGWVDLKRVIHTFNTASTALKAFSDDKNSFVSMIPKEDGLVLDPFSDQFVNDVLDTVDDESIERYSQPLQCKWSSTAVLIAVHVHTDSYGCDESSGVKRITDIFLFSKMTGNQVQFRVEPHGQFSMDKVKSLGFQMEVESGPWTLNGKPCLPVQDAVNKIIEFFESERKDGRTILLFTLCDSEVLLPLLRLLNLLDQLDKFMDLVAGISDAATIMECRTKRVFGSCSEILKYYRNMKGAKYTQAVQDSNVVMIAKMALDLLRIVQKDDKDKMRSITGTARSWHSSQVNALLLQNSEQMLEFQEYAGLLRTAKTLSDVKKDCLLTVQVRVQDMVTQPGQLYWVVPHPLSRVRFVPTKCHACKDGKFTEVSISIQNDGTIEKDSVLGIIFRCADQPEPEISSRLSTDDIEIISDDDDIAEDDTKDPMIVQDLVQTEPVEAQVQKNILDFSIEGADDLKAVIETEIDETALEKYLLLSEYGEFRSLMITLEQWHKSKGVDLDPNLGDDIIGMLAGMGHANLDEIKKILETQVKQWTVMHLNNALSETFPVMPIIFEEKWSLFVPLLFIHFWEKIGDKKHICDQKANDEINEKGETIVNGANDTEIEDIREESANVELEAQVKASFANEIDSSSAIQKKNTSSGSESQVVENCVGDDKESNEQNETIEVTGANNSTEASNAQSSKSVDGQKKNVCDAGLPKMSVATMHNNYNRIRNYLRKRCKICPPDKISDCPHHGPALCLAFFQSKCKWSKCPKGHEFHGSIRFDYCKKFVRGQECKCTSTSNMANKVARTVGKVPKVAKKKTQKAMVQKANAKVLKKKQKKKIEKLAEKLSKSCQV